MSFVSQLKHRNPHSNPDMENGMEWKSSAK